MLCSYEGKENYDFWSCKFPGLTGIAHPQEAQPFLMEELPDPGVLGRFALEDVQSYI